MIRSLPFCRVVALAYLAGRLDLQRSQSRLQVWDVGLEFVESSRNAGLELGWVSSRRAVSRNLIECWLLRHGGKSLWIVKEGVELAVYNFQIRGVRLIVRRIRAHLPSFLRYVNPSSSLSSSDFRKVERQD